MSSNKKWSNLGIGPNLPEPPHFVELGGYPIKVSYVAMIGGTPEVFKVN